MDFKLASKYRPCGDQGEAIDKLTRSLEAGNRHQTLLGVTGSGKTFTVANVLRNLGRPALVLSHNKTLAAQLYSEFKQFFPENAVEYFVSYFDYYQPEAYIPRTDTYIEKDSAINEEIERLRLSATSSLLTRRDVIVVASVSCIYGLGSPEDYLNMLLTLKPGDTLSRDEFLRRLVDLLYDRNDIDFSRGKFRVRGDVVEVFPAHQDEEAYRVEFFGEMVERISLFDPLTGRVTARPHVMTLHPAKQFITPRDKLLAALDSIRQELAERVEYFEKNQKLIEAQRIRQRTEFDLEMLREMGFCNGVENYSRHLSGRPPGSRPFTLLDFFPEDYIVVIDESHVSVPQISGMFEGDRSRKQVLVDHGFRLPSALDNRPLNFKEFMEMTRQILYVSATPGPFELLNSVVGNRSWKAAAKSPGELPQLLPSPAPKGKPFDPSAPGTPLIVEQIIRPTGLLDPKITVRPLKAQIDETIELCRQRVERSERVLITTLTKRTAEDLSDYLRDVGLRVRYLHSDIDAIERVEILRALRAADFDILIGINLLREGLDLPEVSLVCVLDADKEGFLRSRTSLIQTAGRAARHVNGEVVLFADTITQSIEALIAISDYRRQRQMEYNAQHGITPRSVSRATQESLHVVLRGASHEESSAIVREEPGNLSLSELISELEEEMLQASARLEYEKAALIRDQLREIRSGAGLDKIVSRDRTTRPYKLKRKPGGRGGTSRRR